MIKSLRLQDFQSHKDSTFEFDRGLNILVGSSNQGKTACARALSLVLYNIFDKSWPRVGSSFCTVTLTMDSGVVVIRKKGEKINQYILQVPGNIDQTFTNFGVEVPEIISTALNIRKIDMGKDDPLILNYASQLEPLFLFNKSGSAKANVLGHLSNAHFLDFALRSLATEKKQISVEKNLKAKELEELQSQHANLSKIFDFAPSIMRFMGEDIKIEENRHRLDDIKSLLQRTQDWKRRYTSESEHEAVLSKAGHIELAPIEASVQRLKQLKQLLLLKRDLENKNTTLISTKQQLEMEFEKITGDYTAILAENKVCPTCFGQLNSQKLEEIKNNLVGKEKCSI
jgi:exonuclease SbcC